MIIKLDRLLSLMNIEQLIRLSQLDPECRVVIVDEIAEQLNEEMHFMNKEKGMYD